MNTTSKEKTYVLITDCKDFPTYNGHVYESDGRENDKFFGVKLDKNCVTSFKKEDSCIVTLHKGENGFVYAVSDKFPTSIGQLIYVPTRNLVTTVFNTADVMESDRLILATNDPAHSDKKDVILLLNTPATNSDDITCPNCGDLPWIECKTCDPYFQNILVEGNKEANVKEETKFYCQHETDTGKRCYAQCSDCSAGYFKADEITPSPVEQPTVFSKILNRELKEPPSKEKVDEILSACAEKDIAFVKDCYDVWQMHYNIAKSQTAATNTQEDGYEIFKEEVRVKVDRVLRDKGQSSVDTNDAINTAFDILKDKFSVLNKATAPSIKAERIIPENMYSQLKKINDAAKQDSAEPWVTAITNTYNQIKGLSEVMDKHYPKKEAVSAEEMIKEWDFTTPDNEGVDENSIIAFAKAFAAQSSPLQADGEDKRYTEEQMEDCFTAGGKFKRDMFKNPSCTEYIQSLNNTTNNGE